MGENISSKIVHECQYNCNSEKHGSNLTAVLTKDSFSDEKIASYWKWCCVRYPQAVDANGRTLLHMAAAKGRSTLLRFLLKHKDIDLHKRDKESNFSPLHCSLFYGHIDCAVPLIKAGANIDQYDLDGLTPLDHITVDRPLNVHDLDDASHDVYVWGTNKNFILGTGQPHPKEHPEPLAVFNRQKIFFKQVILSKYHSAFLARDGRLWLCGSGEGGRLGLEKEITLEKPRMVNLSTSNSDCQCIALGIDHTIVIMGDKTVWSFGLNTFHQLGHDPPPEKVIMPRFIRGLRHIGIVGVSASKYHSAFWSETRLYTCGLNGGQLGHTRDSGTTIIVPKAVSGLRQCGIKFVTCTYGATVLANNYGEIYLFYDFICRKITSRPFYPKLLCATGGHLDYTLDKDRLQENGGEELQVVVVTTCNSVYIWKEGDRKYLKYDVSFNSRVLSISDITFNDNFVIITSREGKAYHGEIIGKRTGTSQLYSGSSKNYIKLTRIPYIHRAVLVTSDPEGRNFAITQFQPKSRLHSFPQTTHSEVDEHLRNLFKELDHNSYFQDVVFEVQGHRFSAHRYIVGHASKVLEEMMNEGVQPDGSCIVQIDNVGAQVFHALLCFIYTKDFSLISPAQNPSRKMNSEKEDTVRLPFEFNTRKNDSHKDKSSSGKENGLYMKLLQRAAHMFGVRSLKEELLGQEMMYRRTKIFPTNLVKLDREQLSYLWDITLRSEDGVEVKAHKCILVSRLEYFNCMMNNKSWLESTQDTAINLPMPGKVLTILVNYLYTGVSPVILKSDDIDLVFMTLVIADQMFCYGLKNICESSLGQLMNLDNVAEMLQIGMIYNAGDLMQYALEYICQNLGYLLETRALEHLPDDVLKEVSIYYRSLVPHMCMRHITAFFNIPDEELINMINKTEPVSLEKFENNSSTESDSTSPKKEDEQTTDNLSARGRTKSLDTSVSKDDAKLFSEIRKPIRGEEVRKDGPWIKVMNRPPKKHNKGEKKAKSPDKVSKMTSDLIQNDKYARVRLVRLKAVSMNSLMDIQCPNTSSERDFPALKHSYSERNIASYPPSLRPNSVVCETIFKFPRKQERRPTRQSTRKNEETLNQTENVGTPPGSGKSGNSDCSVEGDTVSNSRSSLMTESSPSKESPPVSSNVNEDNSSALSNHKKHQSNKQKNGNGGQWEACEYLELEMKAIEELKIFYNAPIVKGERITVRRAK